MTKNAKKALAVVEAVEPKATETQTPKPEPKPAELSVTARLAINYYAKSISILEGQIEFTARLSGVRGAHHQRMADSEALANAMFLHNMLVDLDCTSATSEAEMVNAMLYQVEAAGFTLERSSTEANETGDDPCALVMTDTGEGVDLSRAEYVALKRHLAVMRGYLADKEGGK